METAIREGRIRDYDYRVVRRGSFRVAGYTYLVPKGVDGAVPRFWDALAEDGRLERLVGCARGGRPAFLGLGSWDPECTGHSHRYTVCLEETASTDFSAIAADPGFFATEIGASDWLCFRVPFERYMARFWQDDPYKIIPELGLEFHTAKGDYSVGLHYEVYPPGWDEDPEQWIEFRITVRES